MSYQIKSTPFFRRMVSTSKRNGQLQKLKEEYERIKEFNERTIEMKMRQVRLRRLFREIEEIKETTMNVHQKRRRVYHDRSKTPEELRMETVIKSRELGKEFSKLNAVISERGGNRNEANYGLLNGIDGKANQEVDRKALAAMRISYGNDISRNNIQKLSQSNTRKKIPPNESAAQVKAETERSKKETLQKRLNYGNSRSSANLSKPPKKLLKQKTIIGANLNSNSNILPQLDSAKRINNVPNGSCLLTNVTSDTDVETFNTIADFLNTSSRVYEKQVDEKQLCRKRALQKWNTLRLLLRSVSAFNDKINSVNPENIVYCTLKDEDVSTENTLNNIPNEADLTQSKTLVHSNYISFIDNNDDGISDEVIINIQELNSPSKHTVKSASVKQLATGAAATAQETDYAGVSPTTAPRQTQVQRYVELFEPIVRDAIQKKVQEMGVHKYSEIFEHKN